jgi:pyrrolidone-carboxylate peptidase
MKVQIPVESGNAAIMNGKMQPALKETLDRVQPEAVYFVGQEGMRSMMMFFDMKDTSQLPVICEPIFELLNAKIDITPAMNLDDLMAGLKQMEASR